MEETFLFFETRTRKVAEDGGHHLPRTSRYGSDRDESGMDRLYPQVSQGVVLPDLRRLYTCMSERHGKGCDRYRPFVDVHETDVATSLVPSNACMAAGFCQTFAVFDKGYKFQHSVQVERRYAYYASFLLTPAIDQVAEHGHRSYPLFLPSTVHSRSTFGGNDIHVVDGCLLRFNQAVSTSDPLPSDGGIWTNAFGSVSYNRGEQGIESVSCPSMDIGLTSEQLTRSYTVFTTTQGIGTDAFDAEELRHESQLPASPDVAAFRQISGHLTKQDLLLDDMQNLRDVQYRAQEYELVARDLRTESMCMTFKHFNPLYVPERSR